MPRMTRSSMAADRVYTQIAQSSTSRFRPSTVGLSLQSIAAGSKRSHSQYKQLNSDEQIENSDSGMAPDPKRRTLGIFWEEESRTSKLFKEISTEVHEQIANYLPKDSDVYAYALLTKQTHTAVSSSVWRLRFVRTYDTVPGFDTKIMHEKYAYRQNISRKWTCFDLNRLKTDITRESRDLQKVYQPMTLEMLRGVILESDAHRTKDHQGKMIVTGLNIQFIRDLLCGSNGKSYVDIIDSIFKTEIDKAGRRTDRSKIVSAKSADTLIYVIQLCLAPFTLHRSHYNEDFMCCFDVSQAQVYAIPSQQPVFVGQYKQDVNVRWLLHVVNFFKHHLNTKSQGLLTHEYSQLESDELPQPWIGRIQPATQPLHSHWKGAHIYLEQDLLVNLRMSRGSDIFTDSLDGDETFQDISIFFDNTEALMWPKLWEDVLCSDPFSELGKNIDEATKRRSPRSRKPKVINKPEVKNFFGVSRGNKQSYLIGRIHAVAPQQEIYGFQRLTMMKLYIQNVNGQEIYDPDQVWAYEGCILPGGSIIVGRWWYHDSDPDDIGCSSGPFIWWNVEKSGADAPVKEKDVLDAMEKCIF